MNKIKTLTVYSLLVLTLGLSSCKKEKEEVPTTGNIKVVFSGNPTTDVGQKVTLRFAKDLYHLQQEIYSFTKVSNAPHQEFLIEGVEAIDWYYNQEKSTPGIPIESNGNVKVEAGKTATLTVQF